MVARGMHVARARHLDWLAQGRQGSMSWMTPQRAARSASPDAVLPEARSVLTVGLAYWNGPRSDAPQSSGRIARYAWGRDYHKVIGRMLGDLGSALRSEFGGAYRWYVDTGPAMDKAMAAEAGLGWYGKNTNILTERFGSWVLLGEVITTLELEPDIPIPRDCGPCTLCLTACPTGALGPEYTIDSRKCISYLTIEHRGPIPRELRAKMGDWVFGCDICQEVCPPSMAPYLPSSAARRSWAAEVRATIRAEPGGISAVGTEAPDPGSSLLFEKGLRQAVDLRRLLFLCTEDYHELFQGTAVKRAKIWMLRRNAAVALGNVGGPEAVEALAEALYRDEHSLVRGHAAWALAQIAIRSGGRPRVLNILAMARGAESESVVFEEIDQAIAEIDASEAATTVS
jgi:epoxyqueuosine reductase